VQTILEAVKWAGSQTGVDPSKISLIGWSYGAGGVLAALKAAPLGPPIAKAAMYYSVRRGAGPWSANITGLMLLAADDIAPPALCDSVAKGMPPEKLRVMTYSPHGFQRGLPEKRTSGAPAHTTRTPPRRPGQQWSSFCDRLIPSSVSGIRMGEAMVGMLEGKSALVTGGGGGIGRGAALTFAREGANVAVADLIGEAAEQTVATIDRAGGQAMSLTGDITSVEVVRETVAKVVPTMGVLTARGE
jgi:short chain dehydrogenase